MAAGYHASKWDAWDDLGYQLLCEEERKRVIADGMTYVDELEVQSSKALKERQEKTDAETQKRLRTERAKINKHLRDIALGRSSGRGVGR